MPTKLVCIVNDGIKPDSSLHSEHGLSLWIQTDFGIVLFDTGQTAAVLSDNLEALGLNAGDVDNLAFSHAHNDHTGGLEAMMAIQKSIPLYANADLFTERFSLRNNEYREIGLKHSKQDLSQYFSLYLDDMPQEIYPNLWTTGKILIRPEMIGGSAHHFIKTDTGWQPDPYRDDMSLVIKTENGLALICGCCHAGLLNTLQHVEKIFQDKVFCVIGGTHLIAANDEELEHVINIIRQQYANCRFYLNHCTGANAIKKMKAMLTNQVEDFLPGDWITL